MKENELKFTVFTDESNLPERIEWSASGQNSNREAKSVMVAIWDKTELQTLRVDVWTKDMSIEEMKIFFHQNMVTLANTYKNATNDQQTAQEVLDFLQILGTKMGILK
ncbi:MAG: gliding motility protein GldC [Bacteroidia bacterium]|nr:gliding motility protein GldC [Bacteroidia bacterium]